MTVKAPTQYDTYLHFVMSGALGYPWYANTTDNKASISILDEAAHTGWTISLFENGDSETTCRNLGLTFRPLAQFHLDHATLMAAVQKLADTPSWMPGLVCLNTIRECRNFLTDREAANFDADSADQVIQVALFGELLYS